MTLNDGKGFWDSAGLCDTLIADCNNAVKAVCTGQYIVFCDTITQMAQKLFRLREGIKADLESKDKIIEELKRMNDNLMYEKTGLPVEGGATNGND